MSSTHPYSGKSKDRLTSLLNAANTAARSENVDFTYGTPEAIASNGTLENTKVLLTPVAGTPYYGAVEAYYTRLPITVLGNLPSGELAPVVVENVPFYTHDILPQINAALGLDLTTDEVVNDLFMNRETSYTLTISDKSLAWTPSVYVYDAVPRIIDEIGNYIGDPLNGFATPAAGDILSSFSSVTNGWTGLISGGLVYGAHLIAEMGDMWENIPNTWAEWLTWSGNSSPFTVVFTTEAIDLGTVSNLTTRAGAVVYNPDTNQLGIKVLTSINNSSWSIKNVGDQATARYVKFQYTLTGPKPIIYNATGDVYAA